MMNPSLHPSTYRVTLRLAVAVTLVLLLFVGCLSVYPDLTGFQCDRDVQCGPNALCEDGRCIQSGLTKEASDPDGGPDVRPDGELDGGPDVRPDLPKEVLCQTPNLQAPSNLPPSCLKRRACWTKTLAGEDVYNWQFGAVASTDKVVYVTGSFIQLKEPRKTSRGKGTDVFVSAYSIEGKHLWTEIVTGTESDERAGAIAVMPNGNVVVGGFYIGETVRFGDTIQRQSTQNSQGIWNADAFIAVLNPNKPQGQRFEQVWTINTIGFTTISGLAVDNNNNIYAAANVSEGDKLLNQKETITSVSRGLSDILLLKFSPQGKVLWFRYFGTSKPDYAVGNLHVEEPAGGSLYMGGYRADSVFVDESGKILGPSGKGPYDGFVMKFRKQDGKMDWIKNIAGDDEESVRDVALDPKTGDVFVAGTFLSTLPIDQQAETKVSRGLRDIFLMRLNSKGETLWTQHYGSVGNEAPTSLLFSPNGMLYMTGLHQKKFELLCHTLPASLGTSGFVFQINPTTGVSSQVFGIQGTETRLLKLAFSPSGLLFGVGQLTSSIQLDTLILERTEGKADLFLTLLNPVLP
ncbi:MAG: hypothetical protein EP343_18160 [Deltaproteobacteria bacterium]|nr:MAG: hypothetical protein EP343_18160 [Deltaproteobacteria bacterium]